MEANSDNIHALAEAENRIQFFDLFELEEIQQLQDLFSDATGVAAIITYPDGTPITKPSNFCRLCNEIIPNTAKGLAECILSSSIHEQNGSSNPTKHTCTRCGIWHTKTCITVGGTHIASWIIGQVRNSEIDEKTVLEYADEIGANRTDFKKALREIPIMTAEQFSNVSKMVFAFAHELSEKAYTNCLLKIEIEKREEAAEALKKSEERLSLFIKHSPIYAYMKEVTPTTSRVLHASENYSKMIGIPGSAMIGKTMEELFPPEFATKITADDWSVVSDGSELKLDETLNNRNYTSIKYPVSSGGKNFLAGYTIDVTEQKQAEQEVVTKNEELSKIVAEKDKLFSIIAHDLRGPFSSFMGLTQIMAEKLPKLTLEEIQFMVVSMRNSATNIYRLLENLLQWSKLQQGAISFKPEKIQLYSNAQESSALILDSACKKNIQISNEIPVEMGIFADKNLLQTIIRNLVSNAVKFTNIGGEITISATINKNNAIEISIKDTGIGMSPELVNNLFRIDFQMNRSGTEGEPSTGLGLILCKEFVEKHGGKIWVESQEGKGSTFSFSLPNAIR